MSERLYRYILRDACFNVIHNIYNVVISFANGGIPLTLFTGDEESFYSKC